MARVNKCARGRRGFSIAEALIALTITATLLTATMAALDTSFKSYKATTESASTNVVARIVMQRLTAMIRTGEEFGPYPANPIATPVITSDWIEFVSWRDEATGESRVTTIRRREVGGVWTLEYQLTSFDDGAQVDATPWIPLLEGLTELQFSLEYEVGPKLKRVTIDMVVQPDDLQDAGIGSELDTPYIRLVASAAPRRAD